MQQFLLKEKKKEQSETLTVLDSLRRSRKSRGGVGAPLDIPGHLSEARQTIMLTDALSAKERG